MKDKIKNWFLLNNNHPCDDNRFYDIVISSVDGKVESEVFENSIKEVKSDISEKQITEIYNRYEDLRCFLKYYRKIEVKEKK